MNKEFIKNNFNSYSDYFKLYSMENKNKIIKGIESATTVDLESEDFKLIIMKINNKYVVPEYLYKFIKSKNVRVIVGNTKVAKGLNVLTINDEVIINVSDILYINKNTGKLDCRDINKLLHYFYLGIISYSLNKFPKAFLRKNDFVTCGTKIFTEMYSYVFEYLYKLSSNIHSYDKLKYIVAVFHCMNHLSMNYNEASKIATKISGLRDKEINSIEFRMNTDLDFTQGFFKFHERVKDIIDLRKDVSLPVFTDKWIFLYGEGTQFALDMELPFIDIITSINDNLFVVAKNNVERMCAKEVSRYATSIKMVLNELYGG